MRLYFIYDSKADDVHLFLAKGDVEARRSFVSFVADKSSLIAQYPEDYDLRAFRITGNFGKDMDLEGLCFTNLANCPVLLSGLQAVDICHDLERRQSVRVDASASTAAETMPTRSGRVSAEE